MRNTAEMPPMATEIRPISTAARLEAKAERGPVPELELVLVQAELEQVPVVVALELARVVAVLEHAPVAAERELAPVVVLELLIGPVVALELETVPVVVLERELDQAAVVLVRDHLRARLALPV